ncbi:DUF2768 family protein [Robertmurraya andreesenii]|uniref:Uncharacterized protein n=1 Tax=Anoxybacillus andreesenii TaxID=1325932 RepID=A0ABT9V6A4_9BACL|nr:hypothetical protein [Robertmurraya andreesenii]MDQ0156478.1 hypothetical protein [Robertmurraya andreesenii]
MVAETEYINNPIAFLAGIIFILISLFLFYLESRRNKENSKFLFIVNNWEAFGLLILGLVLVFFVISNIIF